MKCLKLLIPFGLLITSCSFWKPVGKNLGEGLTENVGQQADSIGAKFGAGLLTGARNTLTSPETKERLDSLLNQLTETLKKQVVSTRDSLLGEQTRLWIQELRNDLLGNVTKKHLEAIRDDLLGEGAKVLLGNIRDEILGQATQAKVALLREELLGSAARKAVDSLVSSALHTFQIEYKKKIQPLLREEESFIKKHIKEILWTAGGIIALLLTLAGIIFVRKRRQDKILRVLITQIHEISDTKSYDELKEKIRKRAGEIGVEPHLRKILREQSLLGKRRDI